MEFVYNLNCKMHLKSKYVLARSIQPFRTCYLQCNRYSSKLALSRSVYEPPGPESGPPFLITHGLLGSKHNWNSIAKATARTTNRKVIAFDARNHGDSPHTPDFSYELMADDILELSQKLNVNKFSLMGHSMGGRTVLTFALKYPDKIEKLVVVDVSPIALHDFPSMRVFLETLLDIKFDPKIPRSEARKFADGALQPVVKDPSVRAFLLTNLGEKDGKIIWKPNLEVLIQKFHEIGNFRKELLNTKFEKPTLFIRGEKSLYIPDDHIPRLKETFVNVQVDTVEKAGHWPHAENTTRFMEILLPFLQKS